MVAETVKSPLRFEAMSCPCEILLDSTDALLGAEQLEAAKSEADRIEKKFSRFLKGNIVEEINQSNGRKVKVDEETASLLDYAAECFGISNGLFDITRSAWDKVSWKRPYIQMPDGIKIDFGGICKEYASDCILRLLVNRYKISTLVNLGGDIAAVGERLWSVGIEDVSRPGKVAHTLYIRKGGVATSGTTKRAGHILNPKTGLPVADAPRSVTVAAKTCTEAGFWSTLAILQGSRAEVFLEEQAVECWVFR